ncbi:holin [Bacillaceae bacterium SIJ1]|uniref:holin n=1 Tax=Litoribacterium kuwaitense TaxID=1398745 RepID=UPI0013EDFFEF|nr:holin [Litoribacterium kuwaitense]NGP46895.1 holin [Litoribacterium kuwaitense]
MNELLNQLIDFTGVEGAYASFIAIVTTLAVQAIKKTVSVPKNYVPSLSLIVGLVLAVLSFPFTDLDLSVRLWVGAIAGLAGTGLFEVVNKREGKTK